MRTQMSDAARAGAGNGLGSLAGVPAAGLASGISGVMGKGLDRLFFGREFSERKDPAHMMGSAAIGSFGKGLGDLGVQLLQDIASKAVALTTERSCRYCVTTALSCAVRSVALSFLTCSRRASSRFLAAARSR